MNRRILFGLTGILCLVFVLTAGCAPSSSTEQPEQFFKGKTITWNIGASAGSVTDLTGRILARYLAQETGSIDKVENLTADKASNDTYAAKGDGLTFYYNVQNAIIFNDLLKAPGTKYEADKFLYLTQTDLQPVVVVLSPKSPYQTLDALRQAKEVKAPGTSAKGQLAAQQSLVMELLGLKGKVITGYSGISAALLAVAQGELDFVAPDAPTALPQVKAGNLIPLFNLSKNRSPLYPDLKTLQEIGVTVPKDLEGAYSLLSEAGKAAVAPPGVPQDRVEYLRNAFDKIGKMSSYQADMEKATAVKSGTLPGAEIQDRVVKMKANSDLINRLDALFNKYLAAN